MKQPGPAKSRPEAGPKPAISPARKAAFAILLSVERDQSHSDDLLRSKAVNALSVVDRNLVTALVMGVLRWQIELDRRIRMLLKRPDARLDAEILIALRMGAFQLLHMDRIPARAVLSESVELAKQAGHRYASGMVNAVLRRLAKDTAEAGEAAEVTPVEIAQRNAHPTWMVERWSKAFGPDAARAICHHGQSQPTLSVRLIGPGVEEELTEAGIHLEAGEMLTAARGVVSGDVTATAAFLEGRVRVQDEGSQLVAEIAAACNQKAEKILDACAAPGGKTLILAERKLESGIVACENSTPRLEQLRKRLADMGSRVECRLADASALGEAAVYDAALADVPCSGTGTLGRNPEIRHRLHWEDLARQVERQRAILASVLRAVRPGGCVVYSTCSLEQEENEQVVKAVLAENAGAKVLSLESRLEDLQKYGIVSASGAERLRDGLTPEGYLRLLPGNFHSDGFFIALVEKSS